MSPNKGGYTSACVGELHSLRKIVIYREHITVYHNDVMVRDYDDKSTGTAAAFAGYSSANKLPSIPRGWGAFL